ncbi:transglycosylase SLT domain-containing protein [Aeromonas veronii]|uniref:transglycosylase SLT domain-containing protein n=1 Tax=Aeromonas veronii TaxID=654 RepID=UPI002248678A|nr:transglycosylase SLT domain-containing protein [Aeromonas veronii]MCX0435273.1 transglycosylase SLT domain-containing protein [Aeromonas veronii]
MALLAGKNGLAGAKGLSHSSAGETAGLAAGGSFFYAMREVTDLASDVSEAMKERNIKGAKDLIPYLRQRASSLNPFKRDKAEGDNQPTGAPDSAAIAPDAAAPASGTGKRRAPSIRRTEPAASDAANVAGRPGAAEHAESISESETTITSERQAQRDSQTTSERQTASQSREEKRVDSSTSAEAASERQTTGEVKSTQQTETVRDRESVSNVEVARGTEAQQGGDTAKAKGSPAAQEATSAEAHRQGVLVDTIEQEGMDHADLLERQHGELLEKLDDLIDSNKPKSPGLVDSAMDLAGDAWGRRRGKSRGKHARARQPRSEASPSSRRDGARARRAPEPGSRPAGRIARVKAAMPRIFSPAASPLVAASATGGAMASTAGVAGSRAIGAGAAAMGARAIPVAGQLLALGMAGYDAYQGFNDKDAQSRAFGLQGNQKATTGQKSAMAAANVLDLGGLTSGLAGLLGSAAGALGFERLQESLTFDTEDMARAIYDGMTMFDHKNPLKDNGNKSIVNNYGSSGVTYRGTTPVTGEWQGTPVRYNGIEAENGLPANFLGATSMVESGGNPNAYNKKSGAMGEFQFMPKTAAGLGLANAFDQKSSTEAMIKHTKQNQAYFRKQMGREATGRELYLLHQQGMGGGTGLIKALQQNPNASAVEALAANGQKAPVQAVLQNGGRTDMTVQEFTDLILNKYDRAEVAEILKKKTGKTEDAKAILNDEKPAYDVPMMLRGGPRDGETAPPLVSQTEQPASVSTSSTTTTTAAPVTQALAPPMTLRPVVDIQEEQARRAMTEPKPYAPVVDETAKMAKTLQNIERLLAEQNKQQKSSPTGAPMRTGGRAIPADHPTRSPQMEAFASDR